MCKNCFGVELFQEEIRVFILHECNVNIVTDILKLEENFRIFLKIYLSALDYCFVIMKSK